MDKAVCNNRLILSKKRIPADTIRTGIPHSSPDDTLAYAQCLWGQSLTRTRKRISLQFKTFDSTLCAVFPTPKPPIGSLTTSFGLFTNYPALWNRPVNHWAFPLPPHTSKLVPKSVASPCRHGATLATSTDAT